MTSIWYDESRLAPTTLSALDLLMPETLDALDRIARRIVLKRGTQFLSEGEHTNELYIIETGRVSVFRVRRGTDQEKQIASLGEGEMLGEISLIDGGPRTLSARAETDLSLVCVHPGDLLALPNGDQMLRDLKGGLSIIVIKRLRALTDRHAEQAKDDGATPFVFKEFGDFFDR